MVSCTCSKTTCDGCCGAAYVTLPRSNTAAQTRRKIALRRSVIIGLFVLAVREPASCRERSHWLAQAGELGSLRPLQRSTGLPADPFAPAPGARPRSGATGETFAIPGGPRRDRCCARVPGPARHGLQQKTDRLRGPPEIRARPRE